MIKSCEHCFYGDTCPRSEICEDYSPITEEALDEELMEMIEQNRKEYARAWNTYIKED